ncbi:hypothetical protein GCM10022268_10640 [Sphingomonas cynarae]|uniref:SGNH hydrolase-type esterase domain-containing protein n=1 Tax=Sphingomonas cynarae TaxID=930197 RepID=A0ABP7DDA1_9SPHN
MPAHPDPSPTLRSRIRFIATMGAVFVIVVGAYLVLARAYTDHRRATAPLPDAERRTDACSLWFIGSSTIFKWSTLAADMAPWDAHNRGVNGAIIPQITDWLTNEPPGPPPAAIVFYGGENDIDGGATGAQALTSLDRFLTLKTRRYGPLPVIAISLKPSPSRWSERPQQIVFNDGLRRLAAVRDDLHVVDIQSSMLVNGRPGPFYIADGIHMNAIGYARWTARLRPALAHILPADAMARCRTIAGRR